MSAKRKVPVFATIVVVAAAAVMVGLGLWQLDRLEQKEAMIARYEAAGAAEVPIGQFLMRPTDHLFSHTTYPCREVLEWSAIAGRNSQDQPGYVHIALCDGPYIAIPEGSTGEVVVGWSRSPEQPTWSGGDVSGIIAPGGEAGWRIVADTPRAGLEANATPDPANTPNNHLSYALQWFFFALIALVIYALALRRRWREQD